MFVSAIMALGQNGEIGRGGTLPWPRLRLDMQWFRRQTLGKAVVMGRRTWDSLPLRPLADRFNIILSRTATRPECSGQFVAESVEDAVRVARAQGEPELVVIGGGQVYEAFWPRVTRVYLTKVDAEFPDADVRVDYPLPQHKGRWVEREARYVPAAKPYRLSFHVLEFEPYPKEG